MVGLGNTVKDKSTDIIWHFAWAALLYSAASHFFHQSWNVAPGQSTLAGLSFYAIIYAASRIGSHSTKFDYALKEKI